MHRAIEELVRIFEQHDLSVTKSDGCMQVFAGERRVGEARARYLDADALREMKSEYCGEGCAFPPRRRSVRRGQS